MSELRPVLGGKDLLEKQAEFDAFKKGAGRSQALLLGQAKLEIKSKKTGIKSLTNDINYQKDRIDFLMSQLRENGGMGVSSPGSPTSPRAGEDPAKQLKLAKKAYRSKMEMLKEYKEELRYLQHQKEQCFQNLIAAFDNWMKMREGEDEQGRRAQERRRSAEREDDYDREEVNDWRRGEGEERAYQDEYYKESPRANPGVAAAYQKAQFAAKEKVSSRAASRNSAMTRSGEWKI